MKVEEKSKTPATFKVAMYDALCTYFEGLVDGNFYFETHEGTDEELAADCLFTKTECVGFEVSEDSLYICMQIRGQANLKGFDIDLPEFDHRDVVDDGGWLDVPDETKEA